MIREIDDRRNAQILKGFGAVLAGAALGAAAGSVSNAQQPGLYSAVGAAVGGGTAMILSADKISEEAEINKAAMEELGESFSAEMKPMTMEVEGKVVRLTGSAEDQFRQWREVLASMYEVETGEDVILEDPDRDK